MRSLFTAVLMLLTAACAHGRPDSQAGVIVEPGPCFDSSHHDAIAISIVNGTSRSVSFSASGASGAPYNLHPSAFAVAAADATPPNSEHWGVILEHFVPPDHEVRLGPGDRAEFRAYTSLWPTSSYPEKVKLRVRDTHGGLHESAPVPVCAPGSTPNNSFKPKPLRGSA